MKGYRKIICKTQTAKLHTVDIVTYTSYVFHSKIKSEKKREKIKQHCKITILYTVQCKQLDTHTKKNV